MYTMLIAIANTEKKNHNKNRHVGKKAFPTYISHHEVNTSNCQVKCWKDGMLLPGQTELPECFLPLFLTALNNIKMQTWLRSQLIRALKHALECKHVQGFLMRKGRRNK